VCHLSLETLKREVVASNHAFVILSMISSDSPRFQALPVVKQATKELLLADPTFDVAAPIDALFGADIVAATLIGETIPLVAGLPVALSTGFGYVIMGKALISLNCALTCASGLTGLPLDLVSAHQFHCTCLSVTALNAFKTNILSSENSNNATIVSDDTVTKVTKEIVQLNGNINSKGPPSKLMVKLTPKLVVKTSQR
jgi:hypothetical protein